MTANYDEPMPEITPLLVKIMDDPTKEKRPKEFRTSHRTIVLTATNPVALIAGNDPARIVIRMNVLDNPVVLCGSISEASDAANTTPGGLPNPNGRIMQVGNDYQVNGNDDQYVATNTYPTRVGITIVRKI